MLQHRGRGQFECRGQAVQQPAQRSHRSQVRPAEVEAGTETPDGQQDEADRGLLVEPGPARPSPADGNGNGNGTSGNSCWPETFGTAVPVSSTVAYGQARSSRWISAPSPQAVPLAGGWPISQMHPDMLDMRVIFMDVPVGRWGLPSVEMETLLWRSTNPV